MLGKYVEIARGVKDLDATLPYYEKIGLRKIKEGTEPMRWAVFTDGRVNIKLFQMENEFTGLMYYTDDLSGVKLDFKNARVEFSEMKDPMGNKMILLKDPDDLTICISEEPYDENIVPDMYAESNNPYGYFGELSITVKDLNKSIEFWEKLGYITTMKMKMVFKFAILIDGRMVIGLHQNSKQETEAITYFSPKMKEFIPKLQEEGLVFREGPMVKLKKGNGITSAPDGQVFFFFKGKVKMPEKYHYLIQ